LPDGDDSDDEDGDDDEEDAKQPTVVYQYQLYLEDWATQIMDIQAVR